MGAPLQRSYERTFHFVDSAASFSFIVASAFGAGLRALLLNRPNERTFCLVSSLESALHVRNERVDGSVSGCGEKVREQYRRGEEVISLLATGPLWTSGNVKAGQSG